MSESISPESLGESFDDGAFDRIVGPSYTPGSSTEVWSVRNAWTDTQTTDAKKAGLAWGANSGLNWEQKYQAWIGGLKKIQATSGYESFELTTPTGQSFESPTLECAETAMFLRATFASWYGLPFYLQGTLNGRRIYAGHFGFIYQDGTRVANFPAFKDAYRDYTSTWRTGTAWPTDATLQTRHLGGDDDNEFINSSNRGAGAYFDRIYLNKRMGYFTRLLLVYFGSVNLADDANMFQLKPEAIQPGDTVLHRYGTTGIGHTLPIIRVFRAGENVTAEIISGSMPRRQPLWDDVESAYYSFVYDAAGGPGYGKFGGGVKRFRVQTCTLNSARTRATCEAKPLDATVQVAQRDTAAIEARVERFSQIWKQYTREEKIQNALDRVEEARARIRMRPATCSGRAVREEAFTELYSLFDGDSDTVNGQYRTLEDYVFAKLVYEQSKTCCWNSTTPAMYEIVMAYNDAKQAEAQSNNECVEPTVFRATNNNYDVFAQYATSIGRGAEWRTWTEDEPCAQARDTQADDVVDTAHAPAFCN